MENKIGNYFWKGDITRKDFKTVSIANDLNEPAREVVIWIYKSEKEPLEIENLRKCQILNVNLIQLYETWVEDGTFRASLEYFEFRDLKYFKTNFTQEKLPFELILQNCCRIITSLSALHKENLSHNNLKSSKILVNSEKLMSLSGFKSLKAEKLISIRPKGKNQPDLILKKSKKEIAFLNDIKNMGKVICEMASVKISKNKSNENLNKKLVKGFKKHDYFDEDFINIVFKMLTADDLNDMNTLIALEMISDIFNKIELKSIKDSRVPIKKKNKRPSISGSEGRSSSSGNINISSDHKTPPAKIDFFSPDIIPDPTIDDSYHSERNQCDCNPANDDHSKLIIPKIKTDRELNLNCIMCQDMLIKNNIRCNHCYHIDCFQQFIEDTLKNVKKKINPIKCYRQDCRKLIAFDSIVNILDVHHERYILAIKLMYSSLEYICICNQRSRKFCLKDNFKSQIFDCNICKRKYCTLCGVKNGHRFSCDYLDNLENCLNSNRI